MKSSFRPVERAMDLAYGRKLTGRLSLGLTLRYINSNMGKDDDAGPGHAIAGDIGLSYALPLELKPGAYLNLAVAASNFGSRMKYPETAYSIPSAVRAGALLHLPFSDNHQLSATGNVGLRVLPSSFSGLEAGLGGEYRLYKYAFLRAGYHIGSGDRTMGSYPTLGAGVEFRSFNLDFAWMAGVPDSEFKHTAFVSLGKVF